MEWCTIFLTCSLFTLRTVVRCRPITSGRVQGSCDDLKVEVMIGQLTEIIVVVPTGLAPHVLDSRVGNSDSVFRSRAALIVPRVLIG